MGNSTGCMTASCEYSGNVDKLTELKLAPTCPMGVVVEGEKDAESYASKFAASMLDDDVDDSGNRIKPGSHKENPEVLNDDDVNDVEQKDEKKGDVGINEMGRTEKMQTPIPTTSRSLRINLSLDKTIVHELTDIVSPSTTTTSKHPQKEIHISSKYNHLPGALGRMCRRQGHMIKDMERKCVTTDEFWKVHGKVDQVLHEIVPQLAERATNDLIEGNLKQVVADTVIQEREALPSEVPALISKEFDAHAPKIIEELFKNYVSNNAIQVHPTTSSSIATTSSADLQQQLYLKMQRSLQDQANDLELWDVLKRKFEKSSTSNASCMDEAFHSHQHDEHHDDDAPPKGEKREKRHKSSRSSKSARDAWVEETVIDEDEVIPKDETPELITEFQNVDKRIPTIFDRARIKATLNDMLSDQFRNAEEYNGNTEEKKYILSLHKIHAESFPEADLKEKINRLVRKEFKNFNEDARITEVVRITTDQLYGLDFMEQINVMRENDKPGSFSEADFKYLNKNDIEDLYYLCQNKKSGIESYQIEINLTAPTLIFPGIEAHDPYSIVDKPITCLIYLNNKDEKRFWKKPPRLGELDLDIMKAYEREITKRLRHHEQMRSMSASNQQTLADSGANKRPPMLEKGNCIPWESRFRRFLDNKLEEGERMWRSIEKGPYVRPMIPGPDNTRQQIIEPLSKMTEINKKQYIADVRVMNYLLQAIPNDIYISVDVCKTAQ
ncbi:hypothetical protein Tco_0711426 [Tanacetum coccineum]